jgi:hypothetical protein
MFCRSKPDPAAPRLARIPPGAKIRVERQMEVGGATWYLDPWRSLKDAPCWVYGPDTVELDEKRPGAGWQAMLDRVLARDRVKFEEYVEVDNALQPDDSPGERKFIDASGPIQFRRLQMIAKALVADGMDRPGVMGNPLKLAWILGHKDILDYAEPDGHWYLRKEPYRALLERYKSEAWAEQIAWALTPAGPGDECYAVCALRRMADGPVWYLARYPAGEHARDAIKDAAKLAGYAAQLACDPAAGDEPMPEGLAGNLRESLSKIALPERPAILRSLDEVERKCKKAK